MLIIASASVTSLVLLQKMTYEYKDNDLERLKIDICCQIYVLKLLNTIKSENFYKYVWLR